MFKNHLSADIRVCQTSESLDTKELTLLLREFLSSSAPHQWVVNPKVFFDGDLGALIHSFASNSFDLLATEVRSHKQDPNWAWWGTLKPSKAGETFPTPTAAFLPLFRLSREAAKVILEGFELGCEGHLEALLPTLVASAGLKVGDLGGGKWHPEGDWYDENTWHWKGPVRKVPGKLHFPVPLPTRPLATARLNTTPHAPLRLLYVSPVGKTAAGLLPKALDCFLKAGADCLLFHYDDSKLQVPNEVKVIKSKGYKWQLAQKYLTPELVAAYDYLFIWDDDIDVTGFDPRRFAEIMHLNRLDMAQPAITSPHGLSHAITGRKPCPFPLGEWNVAGRLTNFVEVMVPVFSLAGWLEFAGYLDAENKSGWGYDYIPLARKGIVDAMPVVHTRAVQSINTASENDLARFLFNQGLARFRHHEFGLILEIRESAASL